MIENQKIIPSSPEAYNSSILKIQLEYASSGRIDKYNKCMNIKIKHAYVYLMGISKSNIQNS